MRKGPVAGTNSITGWGLKSFTDDMLSKIHVATLDVMETVGLLVACEEALDILERAGCWVDKKTQVVKFPQHVVMEAISTCPEQILLAGRDPKNDFMMGGKEVGFTTFGIGIYMIDLETGELRDSTQKDTEEITLLADALPHIDVLTAPVVPREKSDETQDLHLAATAFTFGSKHYHSDAEDAGHARKIIDIAAAAVGGREALARRPILSFCVCPTSPLQLIEECCEVIIEAAKNRIPIDVLSMAMGGASSPLPLSGTLVTHNAEVLGGLVLAQMTNPGAPFIYGSSTTTFDMKHGAAVVGVPEMAMVSAGVSDLANYYGLPSFVAGG
ncbi:MAG: trimethylamine methyltransferase family protein [Desulfobacterales bacterium]|nr:trimethylamine methyltransferase family protein [Desulfobacterales bacterium]